ncbi:hypothetical protein C8R47DRAFT_1159088 [Mycena vitilis]|nr:hypothetical protein C8R47DRAFT_1159088 [Mycena vitilis]
MTTDIDLSNPPPDYDSHKVDDSPKDKDSTTSPAGPYVYYRVYTKDGAIPSKSAFNPSDPFVGRIAARSVPPPRSVAAVKRCITHAEAISDPEGHRTNLYQNVAAKDRMAEAARVNIAGDTNNPGNNPETPFLLVLIDDLTTAEVAGIEVTQIEVGSSYLYYQLYTQTGEDSSKVCFDLNEPSIGRVGRLRICPPVEPGAIKRCIASVEGRPIYRYAALYLDVAAAEPLVDERFYGAIETGTAGSSKERPMVLVQPERRRGLLNRPFKRVSQTPGIKRSGMALWDPPTFSIKVGSVGLTDGFTVQRGHESFYLVLCNEERAYIPQTDVRFLDE